MLDCAARLALALTCAACGPDVRLTRRATPMGDSLRFEAIAPAEARVGAAAPITLRLTNVTNRPVEAHFLGRTIVFDIVVRAADDRVVWRRLADDAGPAILQLRTLAPGETMEWRDTWVPRAAGRYDLQGILPSDGEPLRTEWVPLAVNP